MSALPSSWLEVSLGEITRDCAQRVPGPREAFKYIDIASIDKQTKRIVSPQDLFGSNAPSRARKVVRAGDVLVSMTRPNLNAVALVPPELDGQIASTGFEVLRSVAVEPRWVYYAVRTKAFVDAMSDVAQGALYPAVRPRDVRGFAIPLAPLPTQKRIVDKLDTLLSRVEACLSRLDRAAEILKAFCSSVFAAATSGALTREWRDERRIRHGWKQVGLGTLLTDVRYGTAKKCTYEPPATPVLRIPNVAHGAIALDDIKYARFTDAERAKLALAPGDLLMIRSNGSLALVGRTALVSAREAGYLYAGYLIRLRPDFDKVVPAYLSVLLESPGVRTRIERTARSTAGVNNINADEIRQLPVALPPLAEQHEIVRRVSRLVEMAGSIERRLAQVRAQVEQTTPSTLARAFRGELVPEDPDDKPAAALLSSSRKPEAMPPVPTKRRRYRRTLAGKEIRGAVRNLIDVLSEAGGWLTAQEAFRRCGIVDGSSTDMVESVYGQLRELDRTQRVSLEAVRDAMGRKLHDRLRLVTRL